MAPVAERVNGSQQIQLLYCPAIVYWAGSYLWDMATHLLVCLAALTIFAVFGDEVPSPSPPPPPPTPLPSLTLIGDAHHEECCSKHIRELLLSYTSISRLAHAGYSGEPIPGNGHLPGAVSLWSSSHSLLLLRFHGLCHSLSWSGKEKPLHSQRKYTVMFAQCGG